MTDSSAISFLGIQLPVIAALLPSLVLNKLAVTQALDRRTGSVFYLDVKYGTAKGSVAADTNMMAATTGHNTTVGGREYASQRVKNEVVTGTTGPNTPAVYLPVVTGTTVITNGTETLSVASTSGGIDVLASDLSGGRTGTMTLATGLWTISGALSGGGTMYLSYQYNYQTGGRLGATANNVPEVNIAVRAETITAEDFPLRANFTLGAAIDLEKAYGLTEIQAMLNQFNSMETLYTSDFEV